MNAEFKFSYGFVKTVTSQVLEYSWNTADAKVVSGFIFREETKDIILLWFNNFRFSGYFLTRMMKYGSGSILQSRSFYG